MLRMLHDREEEAVKKVTRMVDHLDHKFSIEGGGAKNKYRTRLAQPSFYQKRCSKKSNLHFDAEAEISLNKN